MDWWNIRNIDKRIQIFIKDSEVSISLAPLGALLTPAWTSNPIHPYTYSGATSGAVNGLKMWYGFFIPQEWSIKSSTEYILNLAPWERCWQAAAAVLVVRLIWQEPSKTRLAEPLLIFFAQSGCGLSFLAPGQTVVNILCRIANKFSEWISILQTGGGAMQMLTVLGGK